MMLPLHHILQKYNLKPTGVIHVGSHWAEEHDEYLKDGIERFVYIEPCKEAYNVMAKKFGVIDLIGESFSNSNITCFNYACGAEESTSVMYVSHDNQGQSNSLLEPSLHLQQHPEVKFTDAEVVKVVPLDNLPIEKGKYDMLVMDVQGYEGEVLKGATETLKHIDIIYTEVNSDYTYANCMLVPEMDSFLAKFGFVGVEEYWPSPNWTWGDKLYIKRS